MRTDSKMETFLDEHRRGIGKSQSMWTDSKMETAGSHTLLARRNTIDRVQQP
jgi:hypothetical protein